MDSKTVRRDRLKVLKKYRTTGYPEPYFVGDEDCLFLNIMRPDKVSSVLRPVFIHIHGGGLKHGNSSGEITYRIVYKLKTKTR